MNDAAEPILPPRARAAREATRRYLEHLEGELARVQDALGALSGGNDRDTAAYVSVEEESTKLANLYVSCARLDRAEDRTEVLVAIEEIVINVIGSEELALFEVPPSGAAGALPVIRSFGMAAPRLAAISQGKGAVQRAARGVPWMFGDDAGLGRDEDGLTACLPLMAETGDEAAESAGFVLAVFQLLPHKSELGASDRELLHVLARQAANALQRTAAAP